MKKFFVSTGKFLYDISDFDGPFIKNMVLRYNKTIDFCDNILAKLFKSLVSTLLILGAIIICLWMMYPIIKFLLVILAFSSN